MLCVHWRGEGHGLVSSEWWVKYARNVPFTIHLLIGLETRQPRQNTRQNKPTLRVPPSMTTNHHTQCFLLYVFTQSSRKRVSHFIQTQILIFLLLSHFFSFLVLFFPSSLSSNWCKLIVGSRSYQGWLVIKEQGPSIFFEDILTELLMGQNHKLSVCPTVSLIFLHDTHAPFWTEQITDSPCTLSIFIYSIQYLHTEVASTVMIRHEIATVGQLVMWSS